MESVTIVVKLNPSEWEDVRTCLEFTQVNALRFAQDRETDFQLKLEYKAQSKRLHDLKVKLGIE